MAFGRKKAATTQQVDQSNVALLATQALAQQRAQHVLLAVRFQLTTQMLMHRWSQKAVVWMLSKMVGKEMPRPPKDLTEEFEASWYRNQEGKLALPTRIIKACIVEGAIATGGVVTKASLKRELRVRGFSTPLILPPGRKVEMDTNIASNSGTPDIRARALIPEGTTFEVVLDFPPTLTPDKVMAAASMAGSCIGLCDWRPDKGGEYGTYELLEPRGDAATIKRVLKLCAVPEERYEIPEHLLKAFRAIPEEKMSDTGKKVKALMEGTVTQADIAAANGA